MQKFFLMQQDYPQKQGIETVMRTAFQYWSRTLKFQLVFSMLFFSVLFSVYVYFAAKYGLIDQFREASGLISDMEAYNEHIKKISQTPEWINLSLILMGTLVFLYPLNLGFYKVYRKIDLKEEVTLTDLFSGYNGLNFLKYTSFYLFWFIIFSYTSGTVILGLVWVFVTLFSGPLMFFMDLRFFETFQLNFKVLKVHFMEIFICIIAAFLFKFAGLLLFGFGILLTFPFVNAMIYTLYQKYYREMN